MTKNFGASSAEAVKSFWKSQFQDEEKWAVNLKILRAVVMFAGSIVIMRNFGDLMAI